MNASIAEERLPAFDDADSSQRSEEEQSSPLGLSIYFTITYFLFYATGWTGTIIPYDALGMEASIGTPCRVDRYPRDLECRFLPLLSHECRCCAHLGRAVAAYFRLQRAVVVM